MVWKQKKTHSRLERSVQRLCSAEWVCMGEKQDVGLCRVQHVQPGGGRGWHGAGTQIRPSVNMLGLP